MSPTDALQSSVLGQILVKIFINDQDSGVECPISNYADNTTLGCGVDSLEAKKALQNYLDRLNTGQSSVA